MQFSIYYHYTQDYWTLSPYYRAQWCFDFRQTVDVISLSKGPSQMALCSIYSALVLTRALHYIGNIVVELGRILNASQLRGSSNVFCLSSSFLVFLVLLRDHGQVHGPVPAGGQQDQGWQMFYSDEGFILCSTWSTVYTQAHTSYHWHSVRCGYEDSRVLCLVHANVSLSRARAFKFSLSFLTVKMWQRSLPHSTCLCLLCATHHTYTFPEITHPPASTPTQVFLFSFLFFTESF